VVTSAPPRGLVATLNRGLAEARAPWLARLDADDLMAPERLERQVALATAPDLDVVSCRVRFFGDAVSANLRAYEAWLNSLLRHEEIVRDLFVESPLPHPSVLVRTERLRELAGYRDNAYPEDYDLWLRAWRAGWRFGKVDAELVRIRDHPGRLTKTDPRYATRAFLECKAEHFVAGRDLVGGEVVVWGAGRDGKRVARLLRNRGVTLRGFVDIAPTKVGRRLLGTEVRPPESLRARPGCLIVVAVGVKGARAEIREHLAGLGYEEGPDFVCFG
jgi:glycosyltransferase involved in cell wall biosynthesis